MPDDAASFQIHLTTTAAHVLRDGVVPSEVLGRIARFECRPPESPDRLDVWPARSVKVFLDDPLETAAWCEISAARNEREVLQLAVRSGRQIERVRVEVDRPVGLGAAGRRRSRSWATCRSTTPTSYYQSERRPAPADPHAAVPGVTAGRALAGLRSADGEFRPQARATAAVRPPRRSPATPPPSVCGQGHAASDRVLAEPRLWSASETSPCQMTATWRRSTTFATGRAASGSGAR